MRVRRSAPSQRSAVFALLALATPASFCLAGAPLYPDPRPSIIRSVTNMAVADFNGDGHLDVAAGRDSILLGNGDGTLRIGPRVFPNLASLWGEIHVGNFNGDGIPDLVGVGRYNAPRIALGKGDGSFEEAVQHNSYTTYSVVVTDINVDGKDDLAYASYAGGRVIVAIGAGDGSFATHEYHLGGYPTSTVAGDFDGDGSPDLVVLRYKANETDSQDVAILLGWHDGTFEQEHRFALDRYCFGWGAAVTDFNHDTHLDLALGCSGTGRVHIRLGNGDGTFRPGFVLSGAYADKLFLSTEDVDRDGNQDVLVSPQLKIYRGKGDGTFLPSLSRLNYEPVMTADFNEDGHLDLAIERVKPRPASVRSSGWVEIELGDGTGQFRAPPQHHPRFTTGNSPFDIVSLDLNGDGALDLVTANHGSSDLSILLGLDDGTFEQEFRVTAPDQPRQLVSGDFNGDGFTDLALATDGSSEEVWVLQGFGNGIFALPAPLPYTAPGGLAVADFDLDGRADLAVRSEDRIVVLGGMADGSFSLRQELPAAASLSYVPTFDIVAADMNQDGHADLVTAIAEYVDEFVVHLSDGQGGFAAPVVTPASRRIYGPRFVVDDFDADQIPDIVVLGTRHPPVPRQR